MKILKMPKIEPIKCPCGCEYELTKGDEIIRNEMKDLEGVINVQYFSHCPFCGRLNQFIEFKRNYRAETDVK